MQLARRRRVQRKHEGAAGKAKIPTAGGAPLASELAEKMEPRLGADLSGVKVHTGGASAKAAAGLGARAFTVGSDVHFNSGQFCAGDAGRRSAAGARADPRGAGAEVGHQAQGGRGEKKTSTPEEVSSPRDPAEKEADASADGIAEEMHGGKKQEGDEKEEKQEKPAAVSAKRIHLAPDEAGKKDDKKDEEWHQGAPASKEEMDAVPGDIEAAMQRYLGQREWPT